MLEQFEKMSAQEAENKETERMCVLIYFIDLLCFIFFLVCSALLCFTLLCFTLVLVCSAGLSVAVQKNRKEKRVCSFALFHSALLCSYICFVYIFALIHSALLCLYICFVYIFALVHSALLCFALLCFALLCFALLCCYCSVGVTRAKGVHQAPSSAACRI
jgi:hypothetical protein